MKKDDYLRDLLKNSTKTSVYKMFASDKINYRYICVNSYL